jgi:hypothetical protein
MRFTKLFLFLVLFTSSVFPDDRGLLLKKYNFLFTVWSPINLVENIEKNIDDPDTGWGTKTLKNRKYNSTGCDVYFEELDDKIIIAGNGGYVFIAKTTETNYGIELDIYYFNQRLNIMAAGKIYVTIFGDGTIAFDYNMPDDWSNNFFWAAKDTRYVKAQEK